MEVDVGQHQYTSPDCLRSSLFLSRIAALVRIICLKMNLQQSLTASRYMEKGKFDRAFQSLCRLRWNKIQAARDMYYAYKLLEIENAHREGRNPVREFFLVRRNRRAAQSAFFVMFMQQFCGVNVCHSPNSPADHTSNIFFLRSLLTTALLSSGPPASVNPKHY